MYANKSDFFAKKLVYLKKNVVTSALPQAGSRRNYGRSILQTTILLANKITLKQA